MSELWEAARFREAAAIYDDEAPKNPPLEATIMRAWAHIKNDRVPVAISMLEAIRPSNDALSARRSILLATAYAMIGNYTEADELLDEAADAAARVNDAALTCNVAYNRARRYLFERRADRARELLPQVLALTTPFGQIRALQLESFILSQEGRHRDHARVLLELLGRINPNRSEHMEIRAWATFTLAGLARELYLPEALPEIERQLEGVEWPPDFDEQRFQTLKALGWACALRGDYFNAFRFLRLSSRKATSDAWRAIASADRAELARCMGEHLWSRQELAEAEEYAANVNWDTIRGEARIGLLLLAAQFAPIDVAKAAYYQARFNEHENIKAANYHLKNDARLVALAQYSAALVDLASGHRKVGLDLLKKTLETFRVHGYDWRAGRSALRLYAETHDPMYAHLSKEHLRNYMRCWLGDELRAMATPTAKLPPMQKRVYEELRKGKAVARNCGRPWQECVHGSKSHQGHI